MSSSDALRTIEADTAAATGRMREMLLRAWLWPLVAGLSLSVGICGGSWAAMRLLWTAIEWKVETLAALNGGHRAGPPDADRDRGDDLGAGAPMEIDGERYVVLPGGLAAQSVRSGPWAGGPAVKLSSE